MKLVEVSQSVANCLHASSRVITSPVVTICIVMHLLCNVFLWCVSEQRNIGTTAIISPLSKLRSREVAESLEARLVKMQRRRRQTPPGIAAPDEARGHHVVVGKQTPSSC